MNTRMLIIALAVLGVCGCATAFTSIQPREDGGYTVTRIKQGFFYVGSNVYNCTGEGTKLTCSAIND